MECCCCGKEINKEDEFYVVNDELYCNECCKEKSHTYYSICDEVTYEEDEVTSFDNKKEAIEFYKGSIESIKSNIQKSEKSDAPYEKAYLEKYKNEMKEIQELLEILESED